MLHSNHLSLRSLSRTTPNAVTPAAWQPQRSQEQASRPKSLDAFCESLPENLSPNKRAIINRLVALYEQGALG